MKKTILTFLIVIALSNWAIRVYGQQPYNLTFQAKQYQTQTLTHEGKTFKVRAYENIVYVANPVDTAYQKLNIYIPEAYFEGKSKFYNEKQNIFSNPLFHKHPFGAPFAQYLDFSRHQSQWHSRRIAIARW